MSKAKMLVLANLPGVQVPDGYMLVQQVKPVANTASNSKPQPTYGKNWSRNQRERMEQLAAGGTREPARDPGSVRILSFKYPVSAKLPLLHSQGRRSMIDNLWIVC